MSDQEMKTTVRVDTTSDTSGIDKLTGKVGDLQRLLDKLNGKKIASFAKEIDGAVSKVRAAVGVGDLGKGQSAAMRALRERWAFEGRMNRQRDREEAGLARRPLSARGTPYARSGLR